MTRRELIQRVRLSLGEEGVEPRQIARIIDAVFEEITEALRDEGKFTHPGFGSFSVQSRGPWVGRNPKTGEPVTVAEKTTVKFKPSPELRERIET